MRAHRAKKFCSGSRVFKAPVNFQDLIPRSPAILIKVGRSVCADMAEIKGTTSPAKPSERINGTGTNRSVAKPMETLTAEIRIVRPAVS